MPVVAIGVATVLSGLVARVRMDREGQLRAVTRVVEVAQRALLGGVPPVLRSLRLAVLNASASAEASIGGLLRGAGDPTGSAPLGRDVRGKGLDAVRLAEVVLGSFRDAAQNRPGLAQVTAALDRSVTRAIGPEGFVTRCWSRSWATAAPSWSTAGIRRRCWARGSPCAPQNSTSWPPDSSGREACCNRRSPTPTNPPQSTSPTSSNTDPEEATRVDVTAD
jgi:hypothetical protein